MPSCLKCNSSHVTKNGVRNGKQRFLCKACKSSYTENSCHGKPASMKQTAIKLYIKGLSFNAIGHIIGVHRSTVLCWVRAFAQKVEQQGEAIPKKKRN